MVTPSGATRRLPQIRTEVRPYLGEALRMFLAKAGWGQNYITVIQIVRMLRPTITRPTKIISTLSGR